MANPLFDEREIAFQLYDVADAESLTALSFFADHSRDTFDAYVEACRRLARQELLPTYRAMDTEAPVFRDGNVTVHPKLHALHAKVVALGAIAATSSHEIGGAQLPLTIATAAQLYLMAGNLAAGGYAALTTGAMHLVEAFASDALKERYLAPLVSGRWTGTMALTEPHAGSSLADVNTRAVQDGGHYKISGSKIFISGGDQDLTPNIVHMVLARIDGAPAGIKGVSLFVVPKLREENGALVSNDVKTTGVIHKMGWRGIPSVILGFGESGDCHGWLVGEPNRGIAYMFQMMNEARVMIGANGVATASAAYHESLAYARERPQGRLASDKDASKPQRPIIEHADVRRMLLRQKAIVEGGIALLLKTARYADVAKHGATPEERANAQLLLDLLTPIAKTFPAELGFESNALAVQVHGGYGYTSEYLPEAWLRDQKLNSIHEGTSGIQALDLLGRKVVAQGGAALQALANEITMTCESAAKAGVDSTLIGAVQRAAQATGEVTMALAQKGGTGDLDGMLLHAADYLHMMSITVVGWLWLAQLTALAKRDNGPFEEGKRHAARYWMVTELPKVDQLAKLCLGGDDSYGAMKADWF